MGGGGKSILHVSIWALARLRSLVIPLLSPLSHPPKKSAEKDFFFFLVLNLKAEHRKTDRWIDILIYGPQKRGSSTFPNPNLGTRTCWCDLLTNRQDSKVSLNCSYVVSAATQEASRQDSAHSDGLVSRAGLGFWRRVLISPKRPDRNLKHFNFYSSDLLKKNKPKQTKKKHLFSIRRFIFTPSLACFYESPRLSRDESGGMSYCFNCGHP